MRQSIKLAGLLLLLLPAFAAGQNASDPAHKVKLDFNRWHDYNELKADFQTLVKAYPKFLAYQSLGKSYGGRDMMLITINNPDTGADTAKPAMYIEANVHGNEIQGSEVALYTVWYLMENYGRNDLVTRLVDERAFYIIPSVNPDGRQYFMEGTGSGARTGHVPVDSDGDGLFEEDGPDDLNGNGVLEQIRKYVPGQGTHRISHSDPRVLEAVPDGEFGDYVLLGTEGIDNDRDGRYNEDPPGGYDPNRNFGSDWQPNYIQGGSMNYPFELPEARAINDFLMTHPNIAGVQSYHNSGGMILRGPGSELMGEYPSADLAVYNELGLQGERMLPYYKYMLIWRDLYTVHGGFIDWTNDGLGIISFSNELWSGGQYFNSPELKAQQQDRDSPISNNLSGYFFDDYLEFGDQYVEWTDFDHPQLGKVQLGGWKKTRGRLPPRFMNEELCHRNMAFTLYQADEMPMMSFAGSRVEKIEGDVYRVWVDIKNSKVAPTIMAMAATNNVIAPDILSLTGRNAEVITAGWVESKFQPGPTSLIDQHNLKRIMIRNGHPGKTTRTIEYIVRGSGEIQLEYKSQKGGTAKVTVPLRATSPDGR